MNNDAKNKTNLLHPFLVPVILILVIFLAVREFYFANKMRQGIAELEQKLEKAIEQEQRDFLTLKELENRRQVKQKSQDELLTSAVAKATPGVVSIVVSKDVPLLEVSYQNPFGDDPYFKNFKFQVPVYRQKGVERKKVGAGTGFIVTRDGYILTNKHVVEDDTAQYMVLLSDGSQKEAKIIYKDQSIDIAIVKVGGTNYSPISLGDSSSLKLGQTVVAIGNALGSYNNSVSVGIVSGLDRDIEARGGSGAPEQLKGIIQTDAAINPGNSGGPLLNLNGEAVGINVATVIGSNNISFSIPVNVVKGIIKKVIGI